MGASPIESNGSLTAPAANCGCSHVISHGTITCNDQPWMQRVSRSKTCEQLQLAVGAVSLPSLLGESALGVIIAVKLVDHFVVSL